MRVVVEVEDELGQEVNVESWFEQGCGSGPCGGLASGTKPTALHANPAAARTADTAAAIVQAARRRLP